MLQSRRWIMRPWSCSPCPRSLLAKHTTSSLSIWRGPRTPSADVTRLGFSSEHSPHSRRKARHPKSSGSVTSRAASACRSKTPVSAMRAHLLHSSGDVGEGLLSPTRQNLYVNECTISELRFDAKSQRSRFKSVMCAMNKLYLYARLYRGREEMHLQPDRMVHFVLRAGLSRMIDNLRRRQHPQ